MTAPSRASAPYKKTPFEWTSDLKLVEHRDPDGIDWEPAFDVDKLIGVVARVLALSLDVADVAEVEELGPLEAARSLVHAPPTWMTSYQPEWWQLIRLDGEVAGFVLPVTYDDRRGRLGTIFHMGVVPERRGRGLSRVLLRFTVDTLMSAGVERIFCDTAANNAPMIQAFMAEGWTRLADRDAPRPHHFVRDPNGR